MARDVEVDRRLLNWARWVHGRSGGYASPGAGGVLSGSGYREATIPLWDCEAEETDRLVGRLEATLRQTVRVVYLEGGGTVTQVAAAMLGLGSVQAVHERVGRAHRHLAHWIAERQLAQRIERERVERVTRASHARGEFESI